jgi:hypothetical protein
MDNRKLAVVSLILTLNSFIVCLTSATSIISTINRVKSKKRKYYDEDLADLPLMRNKCIFVREGPQEPLEYVDRLGRVMEDVNRNYSRKLTHMFSWEFYELAELLKDEINRPRCTRHKPQPKFHGKSGRKCKYNYQERLLFVLEFLNTGNTLDRQEFDNSYARTSCDEDLYHILKAINIVLADEVRWPTEEERRDLYRNYSLIFADVVGILDIWEHFISKSSDPQVEHETFSGKSNRNTKKTIGIVDKYGYFIYVKTNLNGRPNDRDCWTSCDLYMNPHKYFSLLERVAADGGFLGDGPNIVSFNNVNTNERALFNVAFKEVRVGIENAFGRVQMWFPILGVQKAYWNYDDELLEVAVGAATKLHNWLLRRRDVSYDAQINPRNFHRNLY